MVKLTVNNVPYEIEDATRTLLSVLRDELGLVGVKEGCGIGVCGSCTVLVGGESISSCLLLAAQAAGAEILTIEGISTEGQLHPVQQAFIDHAALQCAYCTPGFVLTTLALLRERPSPSKDEIREYLAGNLCRCGSYLNIIECVQAVSHTG